MAGIGSTEDKAIIIGAGFGGLAAAAALQKVSHSHQLYYGRAGLRLDGIGAFDT
jgi:monoamine oxidase